MSAPVVPRPIVLDPYRSFIFPNRIRELRVRQGFPTLLALASSLPEIPYIRLSKIERGEVAARCDEFVRVADFLGVPPQELLVDVDDPAFNIETWSKPFQHGRKVDQAEEEFAILLGAATRAQRTRSAGLTIAAIERDYGIPPVVLSRIENASRQLDRWNEATLQGILRLFGATNERALRREIEKQYRSGLLDDYVASVADPAARLHKTRKLIAQLRSDLEFNSEPAAQKPSIEPTVSKAARPAMREISEPAAPADLKLVRLLPVMGAPLPGGLIAPVETALQIEAPRAAGPRAFGLRICRPTLGAGLPGNAIVVVDPDVFPSSGGLAALCENGNYRLLAITFDLNGCMIGHSVNPALEVPLDSADLSALAAVTSAIFA